MEAAEAIGITTHDPRVPRPATYASIRPKRRHTWLVRGVLNRNHHVAIEIHCRGRASARFTAFHLTSYRSLHTLPLKIHVTSSARAEAPRKRRLTSLLANGDLELPDLSKARRVAAAAPQLVRLTGARRFVLKERRICVPGGDELRQRVAKVVDVLLNERVPEDMEHDMLRLYVTKTLRRESR